MNWRCVSVLLALPCFAFTPAFGSSNYVCATNSNGEITNSSWAPVSPGAGDCTHEALGVILYIYDIGYCTSEPTSTNTSMCSFWDLKGDPAAVEITKDGLTNVYPTREIPTGTYTHSVVYASNYSDVRASLIFENSRTGKTGSGKYCWTVSGNYILSNNASYPRSSYTAECGANPPAANQIEYARYTYDNFGSGTFSTNETHVYSGRVEKHYLLDKQFSPLNSSSTDAIVMSVSELGQPIVFKEGYDTLIEFQYPISTAGVHVNSNNYPTIKKFLAASADPSTVIRSSIAASDN